MLLSLSVARADPVDTPSTFDQFANKFSASLVTQSYLQLNQVAEGNANPGNRVAQLPNLNFTQELRPEFKFSTDLLDLQISPRATVQWNQIDQTDSRERGWSDSIYINAWRARLMPTDSLTFSVGREVLLWGPAASYSPSNPFYLDNGQSNPNIELDGKDFAKAVWSYGNEWTLSYIDNYGRGHSVPPLLDTFHPTQVIKLDHTGANSYLSVNYASIQGAPDKLGFSAQMTVSDAWLVYAEGGYSTRRTQYRPSLGANGEWQFSAPQGGGLSGIGILGTAYTLPSRSTLTMEYINNNQGWSHGENAMYQSLTASAAGQIDTANAGSAMQLLARASQPDSILLGKNYLFMQYFHPDLTPGMDLTLRLTRSLGDRSMRFTGILEDRIGKRYSLFGQLTSDIGGMEFGSYIVQQLTLGMRISF